MYNQNSALCDYKNHRVYQGTHQQTSIFPSQYLSQMSRYIQNHTIQFIIIKSSTPLLLHHRYFKNMVDPDQSEPQRLVLQVQDPINQLINILTDLVTSMIPQLEQVPLNTVKMSIFQGSLQKLQQGKEKFVQANWQKDEIDHGSILFFDERLEQARQIISYFSDSLPMAVNSFNQIRGQISYSKAANIDQELAQYKQIEQTIKKFIYRLTVNQGAYNLLNENSKREHAQKKQQIKQWREKQEIFHFKEKVPKYIALKNQLQFEVLSIKNKDEKTHRTLGMLEKIYTIIAEEVKRVPGKDYELYRLKYKEEIQDLFHNIQAYIGKEQVQHVKDNS